MLKGKTLIALILASMVSGQSAADVTSECVKFSAIYSHILLNGSGKEPPIPEGPERASKAIEIVGYVRGKFPDYSMAEAVECSTRGLKLSNKKLREQQAAKEAENIQPADQPPTETESEPK